MKWARITKEGSRDDVREFVITVRDKKDIYQIDGRIENGSFHGRWHFSFGEYFDPAFERFGALRVFNDDTLTPGAVWPLHPHKYNEVVTYVAEGEFRHADENGKGGIMKKGWVQHTTIGRGMWHSEINNLHDKPMRFIQMWFIPLEKDLEPSVEQKAVEKEERTNTFLPLVSNTAPGTLRIVSEAEVCSSFLAEGKTVSREIDEGWGAYLYVLEGGPVTVNGSTTAELAAAMVTDERSIMVSAQGEAELILVHVRMI